MSEMERTELHEINDKLNRLFLIVEGEPKQGIEGLVPLLQRHMKESKENFKNFKRDIALDYVNDINDLDNRLKPIEVAHKKRHNTLGFLAGGGIFLGGIITNFDRIIKWLTE